MNLIQNEDYAADSCAISPTAFLFYTRSSQLILFGLLIVHSEMFQVSIDSHCVY